jgi:ankyrin repeat protein
VNAETKNRETPLNVASRWGHINVAKLLIANKTDVNTKKEEGETPALKQNDKTTLENNPRDLRPFKRTKTSSYSTKVVEQWLKSHLPSLQNEDVCKYSASLVEDGFDSIDTLDVLEEEHLGFMKTGHRLLLLRKLGVQRPGFEV